MSDPDNTVIGTAVFVDDGTAADSLGCNVLLNDTAVVGNIAVVYRGTCGFDQKALSAQTAGAMAVVIINNIPGSPTTMGPGTVADQVTIPVVLITDVAGAMLRDEIIAGNVELLIGSACILNWPIPTASFEFVQDGFELAFNNLSSGHTTSAWDFDDGGTTAVPDPYHSFVAGVFNVCLIAANPCFSDTICNDVQTPLGFGTVTPNDLANAGNFILDITGSELTDLIDLRLIKNGEADLIPDSVVPVDDGHVRAAFTFFEAPVGVWSMQGVFSTNDTALLEQAVWLSPPVEPDLWANIAGDWALRVGFSQVYTVTIGNNGNLDAYWPTVFLENLPLGTEFVFLDSLYGGESISAYDTLGIDWAEVRGVDLVDSTSMTSFFALQVERIPANSTVSFGVIFHIPDTTELHTYYDITVTVTGPIYTSAVSEGFRSINYACVGDISKLALQLATSLPWVGDMVSCAAGVTSLLSDAYEAHTAGTKIWSVPGIMSGAIKTVGSCLMAAGTISSPIGIGRMLWNYKKIIRAADEAVTLLDAYLAGHSIGQNCFPSPPSNPDSVAIENTGPASPVATATQNVIIGNSWDPNAKYGPGAGSFGHYLTAGHALSFTIGFENLPEANLPAQTVTVIDSLDLSRFDVASFRFTSVTVGTNALDVYGGYAKSFIRELDMQASMGVNVRVVGSCDTLTGVVRWVFHTIDPVTGQISDDALAGFLPPDSLSPNGQGYVSFIADLLPNVTDGDSITNEATIVFDSNPPITTNTWYNVLDRIAPTSQVNNLPPVVTVDSVLVTWSGVDTLSGIRKYDVYVRSDSSEYLPWYCGTSAIASWFRGDVGSTYRFFSIATDSAGNVEAAPTAFDAIVYFDMATAVGSVADNACGAIVYPNPSSDRFALHTTCLEAASGSVEIIDVAGRRLYYEQVKLNEGSNVHDFQPDLSEGVYLLRLCTPAWEYNTRIVRE